MDSFRAQTRTLEFMVIHKPGPCQQLIVHQPPDPSHFSPPRQCFSAKGGFTNAADTGHVWRHSWSSQLKEMETLLVLSE